MQRLRFSDLKTVLCIGAHSDDIEIGAGATILRMVREHPNARFVWVVCSANPKRREEAERSAARFLAGASGFEILCHDLEDGHFPSHMPRLKSVMEDLKAREPDLVFTHFSEDLHQDHRAVSQATWNTFRDALILEYEIPKWDGDLGSPNFYAMVSEGDAVRKVETLLSYFPTQASKHWFDELTFKGLMRIRGLECNAAEGFAEAFYARKAAF